MDFTCGWVTCGRYLNCMGNGAGILISRSVCLWLVCVCLVNAASAMAQSKLPVHDSVSSPRLLTIDEGRSIVNVAWQQDRPAPGVRDCSHFVHQIYANAGFEYAYASSFEIYEGNENFERVRNPHPGRFDCMAWARRNCCRSARTQFLQPGENGIGGTGLPVGVLEVARDARDFTGTEWNKERLKASEYFWFFRSFEQPRETQRRDESPTGDEGTSDG